MEGAHATARGLLLAAVNIGGQSGKVNLQGRLLLWVSENWNETTRNFGGHLVGVSGKDRVVAHVEGGAFEADVISAITGSSLTVTLAPHGSEVREVTVTLRRS